METSIVKKFGMIILMEHDLEAAVQFYKRLGFKLKFQLKDKWAEFEIDGVKLGLCPTEQEPALIRTGVVLEVADVMLIFHENKDWIEFFGEPQVAVHGIMVSFKDPGGNVLDLYQPTPEKVHELVMKARQEKGESQGEQDECCGEGSCCE